MVFCPESGVQQIATYKDGKKNGFGRSFLANGHPYYIGEYKDSLWNGQGRVYSETDKKEYF